MGWGQALQEAALRHGFAKGPIASVPARSERRAFSVSPLEKSVQALQGERLSQQTRKVKGTENKSGSERLEVLLMGDPEVWRS
jgi:hypothetical protein